MMALTIHQPWAWAIVEDEKRVENREWSPPREIIGSYIAIHAGALPRTKKAQAELGNIARQVGAPPLDRLTFGAILGLARVARTITDTPRPDSPHFLWWVGPIGWELDDVFRLEFPLPCPGRQKLWEVDDDMVRCIRLQWRAARGRLTDEEEERLALQNPATH